MDLIHGMLKHMASYVFSTTVILKYVTVSS